LEDGMARILSLSEVKTRLPELVTKVEARDEQIIVTRHGKPAAVIVSYDEFERLRETLDVLSDPGMMRQVHKSLAYFSHGGKGRSFDDIFEEPLIP
jgi:prevent-host-death family protein